MFKTVMITDITQVRKTLEENVCRVKFVKADNTQRVMVATRRPALCAQTKGTGRTLSNPDIIPVYDVESDGYRSFAFSRLQTLEVYDGYLDEEV